MLVMSLAEMSIHNIMMLLEVSILVISFYITYCALTFFITFKKRRKFGLYGKDACGLVLFLVCGSIQAVDKDYN